MSGRLTLATKVTSSKSPRNDGYLLQYVKARNIPCIGIEPTGKHRLCRP